MFLAAGGTFSFSNNLLLKPGQVIDLPYPSTAEQPIFEVALYGHVKVTAITGIHNRLYPKPNSIIRCAANSSAINWLLDTALIRNWKGAQNTHIPITVQITCFLLTTDTKFWDTDTTTGIIWDAILTIKTL